MAQEQLQLTQKMRRDTKPMWRVMCPATTTHRVIYNYFLKYFAGIDIEDDVDHNEVVFRAVCCKEIVLSETVNLVFAT